MTEAAFFDIDDTILNGNSGVVYTMQFLKHGMIGLRFAMRIGRLFMKYKFHKLDYDGTMKKTYGCLNGWEKAKILKIINKYHDKKIVPRIRDYMRKEIENHKKAGRKIIFATNAWDITVERLAYDLGADKLIATEMKEKNGFYTGELRQACHGEDKAKHVLEYVKDNSIDLSKSYAYSDHHSDKFMLEIVGNPVAVTPNRKLRKIAKENNWRIIN